MFAAQFGTMLMSILSLGIGLVSVIVAIIFYLKGRIRAEPCLYYENYREVSKISDMNRKITVSYEGHPVERITTTRIWFWNKGHKPITRNDIPEEDPLLVRLYSPNSKWTKQQGGDVFEPNILDYGMQIVSRKSVGFTVEKPSADLNMIRIDFAYLDNNDGAVFDIQHDGGAGTVLELDGVILGPKRRFRVWGGEAYTDRLPAGLTKRRKRSAGRYLRAAVLMLSAPFMVWYSIMVVVPEMLQNNLPKMLNAQGFDIVATQKIIDTVSSQSQLSFPFSAALFVTALIPLLTLSYFYWPAFRRPYPKSLLADRELTHMQKTAP